MQKRYALLWQVCLFCAVALVCGSAEAERGKRRSRSGFVECVRNCGGQHLRRSGPLQLRINERYFSKKMADFHCSQLA